MLQVRESGRERQNVRLGLREKSILEIDHGASNLACMVAQVKPEVRRHLIVAATACAQLAAQVAEACQQRTLNGGVNILVGRIRRDRTVNDPHGKLVQGALDTSQLRNIEQARGVQDPGMRSGLLHVIWR